MRPFRDAPSGTRSPGARKSDPAPRPGSAAALRIGPFDREHTASLFFLEGSPEGRESLADPFRAHACFRDVTGNASGEQVKYIGADFQLCRKLLHKMV